MKIRNQININFLAAFLIISSIIGLIIGFYTNNLVRQNIYSYLTSSNQAKAEHVRTFINDEKKTSVILAAASVYRDFLKEPAGSSEYEIIKNKIDKRLTRTLESDSLIDEAFIINKDGKVIASSDKTQEGEDKSKDDYFINAKSETFFKDVYYSNIVNKLNYTISSPVLDDNGDFLGVSVLRYLPENLFSIVESKNKLGKNTEENFLINKDKFFITPSRFLGESVVLKEKNQTQNAKECFDQDEIDYVTKNGYTGLDEAVGHSIIEAKDYRNIDVIATHSYIPETGWCLFTKADTSELLSFRSTLIMILLFVSLISGLIFLFIGFFISKKITKPLNDLQLGVEKIKKGDFNYRVDVKSTDEVGELSSSFNIMAEAVKESRIEIENKVTEQTKDLNIKAKELEDQKMAILNILEDVEKGKMNAENMANDLEKFKLAVENVSDHIVITDPEGVVLYANKAVEEITGFKISEVIGKKAGNKELWGGLMEKSVYENLWKTIKIDKKTFTGELNNKKKNGQAYIATAAISPVLNKKGEVVFFVGIERDVTKMKEVDRMKTEFISLASHQLRTPLSAMRWYGEMLLNGDAGDLNAEQKDFVKQIYDSNQRMIDLVGALLNISRIESGRIAIEPELTDLHELVDEVVKTLEQKIKAKSMNVIVSISETIGKVNVDKKLIREVYMNLLTNAIKYTKEGGEIQVFVSHKNDEIISQVTDNGYGIPLSEQDRVFSKFYRGTNIIKVETDGNGLGMYLTKSVVESSGGKIWFESKENEGTTFWFSLPKEGMKAKEGDVHLNA